MAAAITNNVAVTVTICQLNANSPPQPQRGVGLEHSIFRPDEPRSLFALFVIFDGLSNIVTGRGFCRGPPWFPLLTTAEHQPPIGLGIMTLSNHVPSLVR
uniref:Uncharacterized protein n=1 Tax=Coccidioides posadasii RMSCC 3488 TaxID=454284 RepID=A0A0J6F985_COCPO|nr:hypothetical protein CPAG_05907 [Coccidioides posadasii RMSCC 3488]